MFPEPANGKLIIEPLSKKEEILQSTIILAESVNANLEEGIVRAIDPEIKRWKIGETVIFANGSGIGQVIKGKPYVWLQETEIWGHWPPEEN